MCSSSPKINRDSLEYPKYPTSYQAKESHEELLGKMMVKVPIVAQKLDLDKGYRLVINEGTI